MRVVIFRLVMFTLALTVTVLLMPGITVRGLTWWTFLFIGVVFAALSEFLRPVLLFLTGRLLIRSLGLFLVVLNAFLLWLMSVIGPGIWTFRYGIITLLLAGAVLAIVSTLLDVVFGVNRPLLGDIESGTTYWKLFERLPSGRRNRILENLRLQQVYDTIWRYSLEILFEKSPLAPIREWVARLLYPNAPARDENAPQQIREMLERLGPTYVKFGQMLASRSELLPADYQEELAKLHSSVTPFPSAIAKSIVEAELGHPVGELFATFDDDPLAAASTAQVHRATLMDGRPVVVKVQRPDILPKVKADLGIIDDLLDAIEQRFAAARDNDIRGIFQEFSRNMLLELDYTNESYNARRIQRSMAEFPGITVPTVYPALSTSRVLTMDVVAGVEVTDTAAMDTARVDRTRAAHDLVTGMTKQLLVDGFFHGDPHPGNVMVNLATGQVILLDLGMVGNLNQDQRLNLVDLLWSLSERDADELATVLMRMSVAFKPVDEAGFRRKMREIVDRYMVFADEVESLSGLLGGVLGALHEAGLRLNSDLTLALKALVQVEEATRTLDPDVNMMVEAFTSVQQQYVALFNADTMTEAAKTQVVRSAKEIFRRLPSLQSATLRWLDQYEKGRVIVEVDTTELNRRLDQFNGTAITIAIAMILLGMVVGSGIATTMPGSLLGIPLASIAFGLFFVSMSASLLLVWRLFRTAR
jgi:ubiquinone biosynthesis protein